MQNGMSKKEGKSCPRECRNYPVKMERIFRPAEYACFQKGSIWGDDNQKFSKIFNFI